MKFAAGILALLLSSSAQDRPVLTPAELDHYYPLRAKLKPQRLEDYATLVARCNSPWSRTYLGEEQRSITETGRARRQADDLIVGKAKFVDDHSGTSGEYGERFLPGTFQYIGAYAKAGLDLVHVQYYEGDGYILVDPASGDSVEFAQPPMPSPSGRYFAAASDAEAYNFNGVQIAELTPKGLKMVAELETVDNPCDLRWRSDSSLTVVERLDFPAMPNSKGHQVSVRREADLWRRTTP